MMEYQVSIFVVDVRVKQGSWLPPFLGQGGNILKELSVTGYLMR